MNELHEEIFTIQARRCKRCGGLLTSRKGIADGMGHTCKMRAMQEIRKREQLKDQLSLFGAQDQAETSIGGQR